MAASDVHLDKDGFGGIGGLPNFGEEDMSFEDLDAEIDRLAEDPIIKKALMVAAEGAIGADGQPSGSSAGKNIREFSRQIENELRGVEKESVEDYIKESENIRALHHQIRECDGILGTMEDMLLSFQSNLSTISNEIRYLQEESSSMNIRLRNRKSTEAILSEFIEKLNINEADLIQGIVGEDISSGPPSDAMVRFQDHLRVLHKKISFLSSRDMVHSAAYQDVDDALRKLRSKAVMRCRDCLMERIMSLKTPKTNVQVLQQNVFLKMSYCMEFLDFHGMEQAAEVRDLYTSTMRTYFFNSFKGYLKSLKKLQQDMASKGDLIGADEGGSSGGTFKALFSSKSAQQNRLQRSSVFTLGDRIAVFKDLGAPPIIYNVAVEQKRKYTFEFLFRSLCFYIMEATTAEFLFVTNFFKNNNRDIIHQIFARTIDYFMEKLDKELSTCYDPVGLMLLITINREHKYIMSRRHLPVLDPVFDSINFKLMPRFKHVFDLNFESLKQANPKPLQAEDVHPHYITRRYAEFSASIHYLNSIRVGEGLPDQANNNNNPNNNNDNTNSTSGNPISSNANAGPQPSDALAAIVDLGTAGGGDHDMLTSLMSYLLAEMEKLLVRLSDGRVFKGSKARSVFMINNYDLCLAVYAERGIMCRDVSRLQDCLNLHVAAFVEEELQSSFLGRLIAFVREGEVKMEQVATQGQHVEILVRDFANRWQEGVAAIHTDVLKWFSNYRNGMDILKAVLTQLLLYYSRFLELLKKCFRPPSNASWSADLVPIPNIMQHIKTFNRAF